MKKFVICYISYVRRDLNFFNLKVTKVLQSLQYTDYSSEAI